MSYPIGDFDSFETLKDTSLMLDLLVMDFYTAKVMGIESNNNVNKPIKFSPIANKKNKSHLLVASSSTKHQNPTEQQQTMTSTRQILAQKQPTIISNSTNGLDVKEGFSHSSAILITILTENDSGFSSGFSSSTPAALSVVSSADGSAKVKYTFYLITL